MNNKSSGLGKAANEQQGVYCVCTSFECSLHSCPSEVKHATQTEHLFQIPVPLQHRQLHDTATFVSSDCFVIAESDTPSIVSFSVGNAASLELKTENSDGKWFLVVGTAQDYEMKDQRRYRFLVQAAGKRYDVDITVENEDDEYPFFDLLDSTPCQVSVSNAPSI